MQKKKIILFLLMFTLVFSSTQVIAKQQTKDKKVPIRNGTVKIVRDDYGVPHIYAKSTEDLYRAYGYVMAKDRLFQLVMFRRGNEGQTAAIFGNKYLEHDMRMRRDGYSDREIKEMISQMDPFSQKVISNFADGITKYVKEALKNPDHLLSKEFQKYDVTPKPWTDVDVLRLYMASMTVFMDQEQELNNASILAELELQHGPEKAKKMFDDIFPINNPASPTSIMKENSEQNQQAGKAKVKQLSKGVTEAAQEISERRKDFVTASHELGLPLKVGSNAMIVSDEKSESGNAMVFGGPQVGLTAPGFMYEVGLHAPGIDIEGSSFIGYPFIMFGTTNKFAFTSTAGYGNQVDIFKEKLNPNNPHQYKFKGKWVDMTKRVETFNVQTDNGDTKRVKKTFYKTVHGPVIYLDEENQTAYSKSWAFRGTEGQSWSAYVKSNWANNLNQFAKAAREFTMSLNWFYADKQGDIAYFHVGQYPKRDPQLDFRLPTPGTGQYEWDGFKNTKNNPSIINPEIGFVANWNNKPDPNWHNGELSFNWGADHRVQQYMDQAKNAGKLTLEEINDINYHASLVNLRTKWFKPYLLDVLEENIEKDPRYKEIYHYLKDWNNLNEDLNEDGYYDSPAVTLFEAWWSNVPDNLFKSDLGKSYGNLKENIDHRYGCSLCLRVFRGDNAQNPVGYGWLDGKSREQIIIKSLNQALNDLEKEYDDSMDLWLTKGRTTTFGAQSLIGVPHGLGSDIPIPVMNRGSENHYVELTKKGPEGFNITPPGQIGFVSKDGTVHQHYDDQIKMYANWKFKPILFTKQDVKTHAESVHYLRFTKNKGGKKN
ncbi:penicillin acylase family protein [Pseudalkalibacillus decolorationis]|uniref:penicillin acylase family protein n=1 Tax=Pseudalkalibacillus decolorationis TaxID=163879 RepID=UPI0021493D4D|nr:penicillin acylase family protein [Pseudalkalibacillus decolorationis]